MLRLGSFEGWALGLFSAGLMAIAAAYSLPKGDLSHALMVCAFGVAILNIVISEQTAGTPTVADLGFLFVTGFAASTFGAASISNEFMHAVLRMALLGFAVGALAWAYQRVRGSAGVGVTDVLLVAILGAFLPLAMAVFTLAVSIVLTVAVIVAIGTFRKNTLSLRDHVPIASTMTIFYFCVWVAHRLRADVPLL